jgi:hypothetical protein
VSASSQLAHTYQYPYSSHLDQDWGLRLATSGTADDLDANPFFFEGAVERPDELGDMLLLLSEVVRSRFYLPGAMRDLDPVITCSDHTMRFEGFSSCCGVYARADFLEGAFGPGFHGRGTTNVDFNSPMRGALGRMRHGDRAHLAVGSREMKLTTDSGSAVEKKVKLPVRWVKGFSEVQAYLPRLVQQMEVSGPEAQRFLRAVPRGGSPKRPSFVVPFRDGIRLSQRPGSDGVRVMGTDRLRLLEPVSHKARLLRVWADEGSGVSAWELIFESGRLWLAISPDVSRGFSGEGQALSDLASSSWENVLQAVRAQLRWQAELDPSAIASAADIESDEAVSALTVLGARGLVGFDPERKVFFHRELPFDLEKVESLNPRLKGARKLLAENGVRWRSRSSGSSEAMVQGSGAEHRVRLTAEGDRCTCRWFSRNQGERGPCKHILAARILLEESDDQG